MEDALGCKIGWPTTILDVVLKKDSAAVGGEYYWGLDMRLELKARSFVGDRKYGRCICVEVRNWTGQMVLYICRDLLVDKPRGGMEFAIVTQDHPFGGKVAALIGTEGTNRIDAVTDLAAKPNSPGEVGVIA